MWPEPPSPTAAEHLFDVVRASDGKVMRALAIEWAHDDASIPLRGPVGQP